MRRSTRNLGLGQGVGVLLKVMDYQFVPSPTFEPSEYSEGEENYGIIPLIVAGVGAAAAVTTTLIATHQDKKALDAAQEEAARQRRLERQRLEAAQEMAQEAEDTKRQQTYAVLGLGLIALVGVSVVVSRKPGRPS